MNPLYAADVRVGRHSVSIEAVQRFFGVLCQGLGVPDRTRLEVELAIEEGLTNLFKYALPDQSSEPVSVHLSFGHDAIRIVAKAEGRPFDFGRLPEYHPVSCFDEELSGLGNFLLHKVMDSVQWRYLEKEGQELSMVKSLPVPIASMAEERALAGTCGAPPVSGQIVCRLVDSEADALALATCAYDIYRYTYKDVIYYPRELLARVRSGQMRSWIAVDEAGTVFGHYALMKKGLDESLAEMGAAFVRPECRKDGIFAGLSERAHGDADGLGLRGLYSLSVTNHIATQKGSERMGRRTVGIRLASSPAIFVEGAKPGDRVTTVLNYRQMTPRPLRSLFIPERYRQVVLRSYCWLGLAVSDADPAHLPEERLPDLVECQRDHAWNRALITACGREVACHKLRALTELLVENQVVCLTLSLNLQDPGVYALAETAVDLGYFYSGIFPESLCGGHDALQLQLLNNVKVCPSEILLYQAPALEIMDFLRAEAPQVFAA